MTNDKLSLTLSDPGKLNAKKSMQKKKMKKKISPTTERIMFFEQTRPEKNKKDEI